MMKSQQEMMAPEACARREVCQLVTVERALLAIPAADIIGIFGAVRLTIAATGERWYGRHDGRTFPITFFEHLVGRADRGLPAPADWRAVQRQSVAILHAAGQWAGLVVREAAPPQTIETCPFDRLVKTAPGLRGTACLADGSIAFVVASSEVVALAMVGLRREQLEGAARS